MPSITYSPFYPQWDDSPAVDTPITSAALKHFDDGISAATNQANAALSAGQGANGYTDGATLTGVTATATANLTAQSGKLTPVDATGAAVTVSLPSASGNARARISVVKLDTSANSVTVSGQINGAAGTVVLLEKNQCVDLMSDGAGSWWTVGGTGVPDTTGLASQTSVDNLAAQQTQLMNTAATIDELAHGLHVPAGWTSGQIVNLWPAPFACQVVSAQLMRVATDIPVDPSNYWQVQLQRISAGVSTAIVTKKTSDEAETHLVNWSFDSATWDTSAATLAKGDAVAVVPTNVGTVTSTDRFAVTLVVQPL